MHVFKLVNKTSVHLIILTYQILLLFLRHLIRIKIIQLNQHVEVIFKIENFAFIMMKNEIFMKTQCTFIVIEMK